MSASRVSDVDHGYKALLQRAFGAKPVSIDIGILEGEGGEPHEGDDDAAVTVIQVALWNEFGTDTIPPRSFIRAWFDESELRMREDLRALAKSVIAGKRTAHDVLELLGQRAVGQIQARIAGGIPPPNAPSTVRRKGSSTPLIASGQLRSSVSYRVEEGHR